MTHDRRNEDGWKEDASFMTPAQWESGSLTRFATRHAVAHSGTDVTLDAATIADRQREGGGSPRERRARPASRWTLLMRRVQALWQPAGQSPAPPDSHVGVADGGGRDAITPLLQPIQPTRR